jgi:hypothetical protein
MAINVFDGSDWSQHKKIHIYDGSSWVESVAAYMWDGTEWKLVSTGIPTNNAVPELSSSTSRFNSLSTLEPGDVVSTSNGTWENSPTSYTYKWYKKLAGSSSWNEIQGETSSSITLTENTLPSIKYVGYSLRCGVIAKNNAGDSTETFSAETGHVLPYKVTNIVATVKSNDIVEIVFPKSVGANDYYMQYDGPGIDFVEIPKLSNNTSSSVTYDTSDSYNIKITLDLGNADGSLGFLINPLRVEGSITHTGYGANGSVDNLKINPAGVTASTSSISISGFTLNWSYSGNITLSSWELYDGSSLVASSSTSPLGSTSYSISNIAQGGSTYGSYYVKVYGSAPRHNQTQWSSNTLSVTVPELPTPVNTSAPVISSSNGRLFTCTTGVWTNSNNIYSYIYEWKSDGNDLSFVSGSTLDLGTNNQYNGTSITCKVSVITTDLRQIAGSTSNSITVLEIQPDPQIGTVSISQVSGNNTSGGLLIGAVSSSTGTVTWAWSNGTTGSSYYWTSSDFGTTLTLTATATSNGKTVTASGSFNTPDPRLAYYSATSICDTNSNSGNYFSSPSVSGPFLTTSSTSYAIPSDTSSGTGIVAKTVYRSTSAAALDAAKQSACEVPIFAPPFFPPTFYNPPAPDFPPFAPPFFPPTFYNPPAPDFPPFNPPFFPPSFGYSSIKLKKSIIEIVSIY